jgi:hypothetical protein
MLIKKDYCDYETCVALKELGYNQSSIAFYPCQDIIVDCIDSNGELYEAEYDKGNLVLYSSLNNKNHDINKVQAPLLYEAQKFLRKKKGIVVEVFVDDDSDTPITYNIYKYGVCVCHHHGKYWSVKEWSEALSEGIKEAIKILKDE